MTADRPPLTWHLLADGSVLMTEQDPDTGILRSHPLPTTRPVGPADLLA